MDTEGFQKLRKVHDRLELGPESNYRQWRNPGGPKSDEPGKGAPGGWVSTKATVDPSAYIAWNSVVMEGAKVEKDARIMPQSSVQQGARVGKMTTVVTESSVGKNVDTGDLAVFNNNAASANYQRPKKNAARACPRENSPAIAAHAIPRGLGQSGVERRQSM
jgi:hypothetical protein